MRHIEADGFTPFDVMSRTPTSALVRTRNPPVGVIPTILAAGCTILWPAVCDGVEHYTILAPTRPRLRALVRELAAFGPAELASDATVATEAVRASVPLADLADGLTPRQLEAVLAAVEAGYYDVPRRIDAQELARRRGQGRSTFEEHLRKGEAQVMRRFAGLLSANAVLATGARKGRGRPPTPGSRRT